MKSEKLLLYITPELSMIANKSKSVDNFYCVENSRVPQNHQIDYLNWPQQCLEVHASLKRRAKKEKGLKSAHLLYVG
ncbi:CLUMA_CG002299, isoform A [Clunio marinus]|uniref:CLUMA_CG002299, isoform A n=1 Tax=Clunio marinus TaxID=568069 RepID=A0A1J1HQK2_9DIPT|nr:CLUMA_CG002299, isoform A [Clunio marinus]